MSGAGDGEGWRAGRELEGVRAGGKKTSTASVQQMDDYNKHPAVTTYKADKCHWL